MFRQSNTQAEARRQVGAPRCRARAVAVLVEPGRVGADSELTADHRDDAAGHAALGGHADAVAHWPEYRIRT
jgi:hypothetical protein